jgi:uncharacterized Zn finger protein
MAWYGGWKPYVPVAQRRAGAARFAAALAKKRGRALAPVKIDGRKISQSFWGQAWCENLEGYSDFENRLPRGATYVRNGSVIDLEIESGTVKGIVSGSEVYHVTVKIKTLPPAAWKKIRRDCAESISSLIDLLQGRFDSGVMQRLTQRQGGLFPGPAEIEMSCTCPDWAGMCKHIAAVLYGVGARLDTLPELLFTLRNVDHTDLIRQAAARESLDRALEMDRDAGLAGADLGELFGIDLETGNGSANKPKPRRSAVRTRRIAADSEDAAAPVAAPRVSRPKAGRMPATRGKRGANKSSVKSAARRATKKSGAALNAKAAAKRVGEQATRSKKRLIRKIDG